MEDTTLDNVTNIAAHRAQPPHKRKKKKNKRAQLLQRRLIALGVTAAIFLAIFSMGAIWRGGRGAKITEQTITEQLKTLATLSSTSYHFTNVEKFENMDSFYGWDASDYSNFSLSYEGTVSASVDPTQAKVEVKGKNITVTLPEAKIITEEIKQDTVAVYNSKQGSFQAIELTDFPGFKQNQKSVIDSKATASGLLFDASDKAKSAAKALIQSLTGGSDKYDIAVK